MASNGRVPQAQLTKLPNSWSAAGRDEYLSNEAAASLSRALSRAVADTGTNFQLNDAYRSIDEQIAMLEKNYTRASGTRKVSSSDRIYQGVRWVKKAGAPNTAVPGLSNHGTGTAIDIVPGPIQDWFKTRGKEYGWDWAEGKKNGEDWHFTYNPAADQHRAEGYLDHAAVQRVVGAEPVDDKIGTGTVAKIRAWQAEHGLEVDGKVGPATKKKMFEGIAPTPPVPTAPSLPVVPIPLPSALEIDTSHTARHYNEVREYGGEITTITIHYWGDWVGQTHDGIVAWFCDDPKVGTSAHYVASPGRVSRIVPEDYVAWANGNRKANHHDISIECSPDPDHLEETIATVAALVADIRSRHGDLVLHKHNDWTSTSCPGPFIDRIGDIDVLSRGGTITVKPAPAPTTRKVKVDGRYGTDTHSEVQARAGLPVDGRLGVGDLAWLCQFFDLPVYTEISDQPRKATEIGNAIVAGIWDYDPNHKGNRSILVRCLEAYVGAEVDRGGWGPGLSTRWQTFMNSESNLFRPIDKPMALQRTEKIRRAAGLIR